MKKLFLTLMILFSLFLGFFSLSNDAFAAISIEITSPQNGETVNSPVNVQVRFNGDNLSACSYQIDDAPLTDLGNNCQANENITLSIDADTGSHILTIYAWTNDGTLTTASVSFEVESATINNDAEGLAKESDITHPSTDQTYTTE